MFYGMMQDIRHAARALAKSPGFVLTALLSLALGIGINTSIYSVLHTAMERPVSGAEPQQLVDLSLKAPTGNMLFTFPEYEELRRRTRSFSDVMALMPGGYRIAGPSGPQMVSAVVTSANFFTAFRQRLLLGGGFTPDSGATDAVLSEKLWKSRFAADPAVLGKPLTVFEGAARLNYTIVGVVPADFRYSSMWSPDLILQFPADQALRGGRVRPLMLMARVKPGIAMPRAQAETEAVAAQLAPAFPESFGIARMSFWPKVRRDATSRAAAAIVQAVVGLVLLIACVNVMNLLLARRQQQRAEIATRLALGASAGRLTRQLLIESLLLAVPAALAGFAVAFGIMRTVESLPIPGMDGIRLFFYLDGKVFGFALCAGIAAALISGLWPARTAARLDLVPALKGGSGTVGRRKYGLRGALVAAQLALSLLGITAAAMLTRGVWKMTVYDRGVDPRRVMTATVWPLMNGYRDERAAEFRRGLEARLRSQPGVVDVTTAASVPGGDTRTQRVMHTGSPLLPAQETIAVRSNSIGPGFFRVFGIALLRGREPAALEAGKPVCVVNETLARRFWPGKEPLGQSLRIGGPKGADHAVIGVARDTEYDRNGGEFAPFLYLPRPANDFLTVFVLSAGKADSLADPVRRAVAAADPEMPIQSMGALAERLTGGPAAAELRLRAMVIGTLGATALLLSALGLYGVASYLAGRRTREIGIRLALGATRRDILRGILGDSLRLAAIGMAAGIVLSLIVCPLLTARLYGVKPNDPWVIAASCAILAATNIVAVWAPSWKACRLEASAALRHD